MLKRLNVTSKDQNLKLYSHSDYNWEKPWIKTSKKLTNSGSVRVETSGAMPLFFSSPFQVLQHVIFIMFTMKKSFFLSYEKSLLCCGYRIASHCITSHHDTALWTLLSPFGRGKNSLFLSVQPCKWQSYFTGYLRQSALRGEEIRHLHSPPGKHHVVPKNQRKDTKRHEFYGSHSLGALGKTVQLKTSAWPTPAGSSWNHCAHCPPGMDKFLNWPQTCDHPTREEWWGYTAPTWCISEQPHKTTTVKAKYGHMAKGLSYEVETNGLLNHPSPWRRLYKTVCGDWPIVANVYKPLTTPRHCAVCLRCI